MAAQVMTERRWDQLERRGITRRYVKSGIIYAPDEPATELGGQEAVGNLREHPGAYAATVERHFVRHLQPFAAARRV